MSFEYGYRLPQHDRQPKAINSLIVIIEDEINPLKIYI